MSCESSVAQARSFLLNERLRFERANLLWDELKKNRDQLSLAWQVLARMREEPDCLSDGVPTLQSIRDKLIRQEALLVSKDPELNPAVRHDDALALLAQRFDFISDKTKGGDGEMRLRHRRWHTQTQVVRPRSVEGPP